MTAEIKRFTKILDSELDMQQMAERIIEATLGSKGTEDDIRRKRYRLSSLKNNRVRMTIADCEEIGLVFPQYEIWLKTGIEFPEHGHVSPDTKFSEN